MSAPANPRAFPSNAISPDCGGMTLRDWFAGQALSAVLTDERLSVVQAAPVLAELAYVFADAMLAERETAGVA